MKLSIFIILIPTPDFPHFWKSGVTFVRRCFRDYIMNSFAGYLFNSYVSDTHSLNFNSMYTYSIAFGNSNGVGSDVLATVVTTIPFLKHWDASFHPMPHDILCIAFSDAFFVDVLLRVTVRRRTITFAGCVRNRFSFNVTLSSIVKSTDIFSASVSNFCPNHRLWVLVRLRRF